MVVGAAFVLGVLVAYGTLGGGFIFFISPPYLAKESSLTLAYVSDGWFNQLLVNWWFGLVIWDT